jgi:hypothetical protein
VARTATKNLQMSLFLSFSSKLLETISEGIIFKYFLIFITKLAKTNFLDYFLDSVGDACHGGTLLLKIWYANFGGEV